MRACNEPQKTCTKRDFADAHPRATDRGGADSPADDLFRSRVPFREGWEDARRPFFGHETRLGKGQGRVFPALTLL